MSLAQGNDPGWTSFSEYKMYTVELTAKKPWMNYVNNRLKQIFDYWSCYLL